MQKELIAGDTLNYRVAVRNYPSSEGWVLKFRLVPRTSGAAAIELEAQAADSDEYLVRALSSVTSAWAPGQYGWSSWVQNNQGERYTVESGHLQVLPDPATVAAGTDLRSQARRALDDARAAFAAWSPLQKRYKIADREREFNSPAEILVVLRHWEQQVLVEERLAGRAEPVSRRIYTRI
jgi:hypothetical protein